MTSDMLYFIAGIPVAALWLAVIPDGKRLVRWLAAAATADLDPLSMGGKALARFILFLVVVACVVAVWLPLGAVYLLGTGLLKRKAQQ